MVQGCRPQAVCEGSGGPCGCWPQTVCEGSVWSKAVGPRQCVRGPCGLRLLAPDSV